MSAETAKRFPQLAEQDRTLGRKVSPMQLAAQILEDLLATYRDEEWDALLKTITLP
jgi:hypothetical protein